jgi:hypothetical protein
MAQIFHPSTNTLSKVSIFGFVFLVGGLLWLVGAVNRSPYMTGEQVVIDQPVPFSHEHHVSGLGIDCRYCHTSVEESAMAGIPPTKTCMTCHSQVWSEAPMLEPVRESFRRDLPIPWVRVHDLPDFAYFNHAIHLEKGIGCFSCHGPVDRMPLMYRENSLNMEWCLSCHRDPLPHLRPREELFDMGWRPEMEDVAPERLAAELAELYQVRERTSCYTCHR